MRLPKDLVAASATPLVLAILDRGDSYGYAIIREVRERSGGQLDWAEGMLYPILHRLEARSLIESYEGDSERGRKRRYYTLTEAGRRELIDQQRHWRQLTALLSDIAEDPVAQH